MYYAALCAIAKDEDSAIRYWVDYHLLLGFEHVTIFDNMSATPISELLSEHIGLGLVDVVRFDVAENQQLSAYYAYLQTCKDQTRWAAFFDIDEYLVLKNKDDVKDFLMEYEAFSGVGVHWVVFGSNGHLKRPDSNVPASYRRYLYKDNVVKSIVKPGAVTCPKSPHHFTFRDGQYCVNEDKLPILGPFSYHTSNSFQLNHYYYQSQQDFFRKMERGFATPVMDRANYSMDEFYWQHTQADYEDDAIERHLKKLVLFEKRPVAVLARVVTKDCSTSCESYIEKIAGLVIHSKLEEALAQFDKAGRYYDELRLYLVGVMLYSLLKQHENVLFLFRKMLLKYEACPSSRTLIYSELSKYYKSTGQTEQSWAIDREVSR